MEKKKAEAILNFASLFINELIKMTKIPQILVNPKKNIAIKKRGKEKSGSKSADPACIFFVVVTVKLSQVDGAVWASEKVFWSVRSRPAVPATSEKTG